MKKKNIPSSSVQAFWNGSAGFLNAFEAVLMTFVATRFVDLEAAGELTIAFALGNLFRTVGLWGTRNYHISDQRKEYDFSEYLFARFFSIVIMFFLCAGYIAYISIIRKTIVPKILVISFVFLIFLLDCFEDVIWGEYQRRGRIDIGAKIFIARWGSLLFSFSILVILLRSIVFALIISFVVSIIIFLVLILLVFRFPSFSFDGGIVCCFHNAKKILLITSPLFLSTFLIFFLNNIAKYSIDYYYNDIMQACFGFIALPSFLIEMVSGFLYQPKLVKISVLWRDNKYKFFIKEIFKQILFIFFVTLASLFVSFIIGIKLLSLIFATDLIEYRLDLCFVMISGGMIAMVFYASAVLTIMRKQNIQLIVYSLVSLFGGVFICKMVNYFGIRGATLGNMIVFGIQAIIMYIIIFYIMFSFKSKMEG